VSLAAPQAAGTGLHGLRVYLDSLGCAKNLVDSEAMLGMLQQAGSQRCEHPDDADILLVNTCGFLEAAREESVHRILELAQCKTTGRPRVLGVLGCLVSRAPEELAQEIPEVDVWLPAGSHGELPQRLGAVLARQPSARQRQATDRSGSGRAPQGAFAGFGSRVLLTPPHTAYLKISEGCSNSCTFCSIPLMRGTQRSRPLADLVREATQLAHDGVRELHVVAQDLTHWGFDLPGRPDLLDLVTALDAVPGLEWIRLLYAHPKHFTERMMHGLFTLPHVARYLDMPVQHASDRLLRNMRRPYSVDHARRQFLWLREHVPDISLRTSVIVGFPGETEADFRALCRFVSEIEFDHLGIFTYSREPGTPSYDMRPRPRFQTAQRRLQELNDLQLHISSARARRRVGSTVRILIDAPASSLHEQDILLPAWAQDCAAVGRSPGEALDIDSTLWVDAGGIPSEDLRPGTFVDATIVQADVHDLQARAHSVWHPVQEAS
jgi:ribosomal protein S12 methylthiotransferase